MTLKKTTFAMPLKVMASLRKVSRNKLPLVLCKASFFIISLEPCGKAAVFLPVDFPHKEFHKEFKALMLILR